MGKFITFDREAMLRQMQEMAKRLQMNMMQEITNIYRINLASNTFNPLDVKHISSMMSSITTRVYSPMVGTTIGKIGIGNRLVTNQYFRVVYYEYGTGQLAMTNVGYNPAADPFRNPARGGDKRFYSWKDDHVDMGGNPRKGNGKKPTLLRERTTNGKVNHFAVPIQPHFNLGRAMASSPNILRKNLRTEVSKMNPVSYTSLRGIKVRA